MKRITVFVLTILVLAVFIFGGTAALAVSRSSHRDSAYSNALGGSATLKVTQCCSNGRPNSYVKVRLTARLVTGSTDTYYTYGSASSGTDSLTHTSSKSVSSSNQVVGTAHVCYAKCGYCGSTVGDKGSYHHN